MVASTLRSGCIQTGLRPFDPCRDLGPVAELMLAAFGDDLDPSGLVALAEMRRAARWGPLLWWLYSPGWGSAAAMSGFVWVEEGRVVGNASLRRAMEWGGFFVGNVAVSPKWQGRGIASRLMEAALEEVSARGGRWVGLEVQAGNQIARQLYECLGFREVGRLLRMLRPAGRPWAGELQRHPALRRGCSRDSEALIKLMRAIVPVPQRSLLELREQDYRLRWEHTLDRWLSGQREVWWVVEEDGVICGAVRALRERRHRPDRLEVLVAPGHSGLFEALLVRQGLASLRGVPRRMVETELSDSTQPLVAALEEAGFERLRVLIQMRLDLTQHILVRNW